MNSWLLRTILSLGLLASVPTLGDDENTPILKPLATTLTGLGTATLLDRKAAAQAANAADLERALQSTQPLPSEIKKQLIGPDVFVEYTRTSPNPSFGSLRSTHFLKDMKAVNEFDKERMATVRAALSFGEKAEAPKLYSPQRLKTISRWRLFSGAALVATVGAVGYQLFYSPNEADGELQSVNPLDQDAEIAQ